MARTSNRRGAGGAGRGKREAIADLMLETAQFFFRLRAAGQKAGFINAWGGGAYGFLRSLALMGPLTVPSIAQMRPTSRQRMQRLADELHAEGFVEFVDNPRHRKSKLVRLTRRGQARYRDLSASLLDIASTLGSDLDASDVRKTCELVHRLSEEVRDLSR